MSFAVSGFYLGLGALWMFFVSWQVIKGRRSFQVGLGDGNQKELQRLVRIHGNAAEFLPLGLLIIACHELQGANAWLLHALGVALLLGRVLHFSGLKKTQASSPGRYWGMVLTFLVYIVGGSGLVVRFFLSF